MTSDADLQWAEVAKLSDLDPEFPTMVEIEGVELALGQVDSTPFAVFNICSHAFARLSDGHVSDYEIVCPLHQGSFDVRTGEAVASPCYEPIRVYPTCVRDGIVFVDASSVKESELGSHNESC